MILVGQKIAHFSGTALIDDSIQTISPTDLAHPKIFIFYPLDFTFVCPTELHSFQEEKNFFDQKNITLYGISVDSVYSHLAWLKISRLQGGIQGISFPLMGDLTKSISRHFGVLNEEAGIAYRAIYVVDKNNIVQAIHMTNNSIGRSVEEIKRLVEAMLFVEQYGDNACPANWTPDKKSLKPTISGICEYFQNS